VPIGLKGNSDGSGAIQIGGSDAISITTGLNTTFAGTITASGGVMYPLTSGTAIASTSGTALDFTGIPSWVKRITVMLNGVSTNGTSNIQIQIGSGSFTTSGYTSSSANIDGTNATTVSSGTSGFLIYVGNVTAASSGSGVCTINLITGNTYVHQGQIMRTSTAGLVTLSTGFLALGGTLDRVRITTVNGTDTFDAGSINLLWE
jgi:hypothetical protein